MFLGHFHFAKKNVYHFRNFLKLFQKRYQLKRYQRHDNIFTKNFSIKLFSNLMTIICRCQMYKIKIINSIILGGPKVPQRQNNSKNRLQKWFSNDALGFDLCKDLQVKLIFFKWQSQFLLRKSKKRTILRSSLTLIDFQI